MNQILRIICFCAQAASVGCDGRDSRYPVGVFAECFQVMQGTAAKRFLVAQSIDAALYVLMEAVGVSRL